MYGLCTFANYTFNMFRNGQIANVEGSDSETAQVLNGKKNKRNCLEYIHGES